MVKEAVITKIHEWTSVAPLLAATFAPFCVLFDIPALTESWFLLLDGAGIPDKPGSLVLSAVGLAVDIFANALLLVRFSTSIRMWKTATRVSLAFWIAKVMLSFVNMVVFGRMKPGSEQRGEGFWCALVSLILSGLISFLLLAHWMLEVRDRQQPDHKQLAVRVAGRHFMLNVMFFVIDVGLLALVGSKMEKWTYLQGMYFAIVTYLTIGFGDFTLTRPFSRVLLFFFAVVGIAQLGNIVGMLVEFFRSQSHEKRESHVSESTRRRREKEEAKMSEARSGLKEEIDFLRRLGESHDKRIRRARLWKSVSALLVFWFVGAVIFSRLEGWAYGTSLYFSYVSFLTIGYGDVTPDTPAGRVVFILYAIIAVPIIASFAVQAVQQVFAAFSKRQYDKTKVRHGLAPDIECREQARHPIKIFTHSDFVEKWHQEWDDLVHQDTERRDETNMDGNIQEFDEDARLTEQILEFALSLESRARKLLITHLHDTANTRGALQIALLLLRADRNMQLREVKTLLNEIELERAIRRDHDGDGGSVSDVRPPGSGSARSARILRNFVQDDPDALEFPAQVNEHHILGEVRRYREDFAGLLAAGSRLMGLKGRERALFERRSVRRVRISEERARTI